MPMPYEQPMMGAGMPPQMGMGAGMPPQGMMPPQQQAQSPLAHLDRMTLEQVTMNLIAEVEQLRMMVEQQQHQPPPMMGAGGGMGGMPPQMPMMGAGMGYGPPMR